ncbi:MAG: hypothetical protein ACOCSL_05605 [Thermoplasmatota archaeon]
MAEKLKNEFREFLHVLRENRKYFLSHHPDCSEFEDDVYHFMGKKFCVGCFTAYPTAGIIIMLWILGLIRISTTYAFLIGLSLGSIQFLSLTSISDMKFGKIIIKVFLGLGIGFFIIAIFSLPVTLVLRLLLFFISLNVAGFFSFLRMRKIKARCEECEFEKDWSICPGFTSDPSRDAE